MYAATSAIKASEEMLNKNTIQKEKQQKDKHIPMEPRRGGEGEENERARARTHTHTHTHTHTPGVRPTIFFFL